MIKSKRDEGMSERKGEGGERDEKDKEGERRIKIKRERGTRGRRIKRKRERGTRESER